MKLRYRIGTKIIYYIWKIVFGFRIEGRDNVPLKGGVIIAPNHLSNFDPPLVGTAVWNRECYFLSKTTIFSVNKFYTFIMKTFNAYAVNIDKPEKGVLQYTKDLLHKKLALVMFPEGTRSRIGHFTEFSQGVAWVALQCMVPIVPVVVVNTNTPLISQLIRKNRVLIKFGIPITTDFYHQFNNSKVARKMITQELKSRMEAMAKNLR